MLRSYLLKQSWLGSQHLSDILLCVALALPTALYSIRIFNNYCVVVAGPVPGPHTHKVLSAEA